ncbi:MAG: hypothetical protein PHY42_03780 [Bacilli bacterium]|nr:hypothetical protein [Bacilli bacterium]
MIRKKNNESFNQYRGFTNDIYAHDNHSTNDALPEIHRKTQDWNPGGYGGFRGRR